MADDPFAKTRCVHCAYAKHICDLLKMQGEACCPKCEHPKEDDHA